MSNGSSNPVMAKVRRSLRRTGPLAAPPVPPKIDEPVARLVHSDIGLGELFVQRAGAMKMIATPISVDDLHEAMAVLRETCPVAHSDQHGGYWILTRHADVVRRSRPAR